MALRGRIPATAPGDSEASLYDLFTEREAGGGIACPADLLGKPPFLDSWCNVGAFQALPLQPERDDDLARRWRKLRTHLQAAYLVTVMQATALVRWVREHADLYTKAVAPLIVVDSHARTARVTYLGRSREARLTPTNLIVLQDFMRGGTSGVVRRNAVKGNAPGALVRRIPELGPHIVASRARAGRDPDNDAVYRISKLARDRLSIGS